ncbi:hypothetical protein GDO78_009628, partial [Eleutherodactylus coqui]
YTVNTGGVVLSLQGCSHMCQTTTIQPKCCKGYWGSICAECPGGPARPCSNHGTCMEGLQGNGTCICNEGFTGFACNECSDPTLYGVNCDSACNCIHGVCKRGRNGDGRCICEAGYKGLTCEEESVPCSKKNCGPNASCVELRGVAICDCMPGYYRKGSACEAKDPCSPSQCSPYAICKSSGPQQYTCTCRTDYYGDGKTCLPFNPCSVNNGGCIENSTKCVYKSPGKQFIKETEPDQTYKIIKIDFPAVNGIFHVIDNPIRSNNLEAIGNRQMTIGDIIATNGMFSSFHTMLENCGLPSILNGHGTFTVLVPTNKAVDSIRDGRLIHLFIEAKHKLLELVSYHISSVAAITIDRLITMPHILTSLNEFLKINVTGNGRILFGDGGVPLVHSDIVASNGIIHVLDGILIPSTILPILPATCNETKKEVVQVNGCCKGFYGPDCKPCPGGFSNPCYGRGTCNDGMNGNGKCECYHRYKGIACHICTEPNKHGDECEEECRCLHGICDNRPGSRGICQGGRCNVGYIGEYCDRLSEPCTAVNMTQYCHVNAVCVSTDNITSCLCKNGYQGDGSFCQPLDQCKMPDRGGCSENAICTIAPTGGVICQCIPGWTGDGIECIPIDNCALENRSGCDINADCKFVRPGKANCTPTSGGQRTCACPDGFGGDGITCYADVMMKSEISISLSSNVTALIPSNAALGTLSESTRKFWEDKLSYLVRVHFLRGAFTSEDLKQHIGQELDTMDPKTKWEIGTIKGLLIPPPGAIPPARPGLYQMLDQVPAFTQFKQAIQKIGLIQEIESSGQKYTIFVPNNSSVSGFYNQSGFTDLNNITIQYHIILGEKLAPSDISNGMHRSSMLGVSYWLMFYKRYNQTFVHDVPLDGSFYETNNGILMGISQVIKVLKNRCDISKTIVTKDSQCCEGYYGHQCLVCPGGLNNICSNNGKCQDRINGTGECICKEGFHGTACETCEAGRFGKDCKADRNILLYKYQTFRRCEDSTQCEIITCKGILCCISNSTKPPVRCSCIAGYAGNGTHCTEIDPCTVNNGGCSKYANCTKEVFGQAHCTCIDGYSGDGIICLEIDACLKNNGGCHRYAECTKTGPNRNNGGCSKFAMCLFYGSGTRICRCSFSFRGDGFTCTGNIAQMLRYAEETQDFYFRLLSFDNFLSGDGPFTVFVPQNAVMSNSTEVVEWRTNGIFKHLLQYHIVGCQKILTDDLQKMSSLTTISGGTLRVSTKNGEVYLNDFARITKSDMEGTDGVIHIIDQVLIPEVPVSNSSNPDSKLISVVQDKIHQPITVLLPTNEAFASLPDQQKLWLYHEDHRDKLKAYLKAHIIRSTKVMAVALPAAKSLRTLHGSTISFQCSSTNIGEILVDNNNAKIVKRDMEFIGGIAHGIDHLLEPPNLGARCDEFTETKVDCYTVTWVPQCCKNHYGGDCHVCPGGLEAPCNNHGTCTDGLEGNGQCSCSLGFTGTACEICAPKRYGPDCEECTCSRNGQCNEGISGDGSCFCAEGWFGEKCETKQPSAPVCSPKCDSNAMCRANNECECNPVYEGDGRTCSVIDLCSTYNGGCSLHAKCSQTETRLSCECLPEYEGDGRICIPINLCIKDENGGCSEHATCFYTGPKTRRCECHEGYVGNGVQCLEKVIPPVDRCLEENGGCADQASCEDWHYQEKTGGVFHLQSPKGNYQYTYEDAEKACASEGARIATFQQLSAAQQLGYHRCLIGWLYNRTAGYPTVYPNARCGNNHVGIVEHKLETNTRETLDVYCYRLQDTDCQCPDGYVGDGSFCNGNLLQVLEANPRLSKFYSMVLDNGMINSQGSEFIDVLSNRTSYRTLFVPDDASLDDNATLTLRDLEHHISKLDILVPYSNLTHGSTMLSKLGYNLLISHTTNCSTAPCPKVVNDNVILYWDIPAFNGIIHIIKGPLVAPPVQVKLKPTCLILY